MMEKFYFVSRMMEKLLFVSRIKVFPITFYLKQKALRIQNRGAVWGQKQIFVTLQRSQGIPLRAKRIPLRAPKIPARECAFW